MNTVHQPELLALTLASRAAILASAVDGGLDIGAAFASLQLLALALLADLLSLASGVLAPSN